MAEAKRLATELGGELQDPVVKWKYRPLEWLCGYGTAMRAANLLPRLRAEAARNWDRLPVPQVSGSPRACLHIARWWRRRQVRNEP